MILEHQVIPASQLNQAFKLPKEEIEKILGTAIQTEQDKQKLFLNYYVLTSNQKEGGITMAKLFAYQIGQNPRIQTDLLVDPQLFEDEHGCMGAVGGLADCVQTGMFTDIEVIKRYLHEATYVLLMVTLTD